MPVNLALSQFPQLMKFLIVAWVTWFGMIFPSAAAPDGPVGRSLDALLTGDALWDTTPDQFAQTLGPAGVQWLDTGKSRARFFGPGLTIAEGKVVVLEANCDFKEGKLAGSSISLFNRGDSVKVAANEREFEQQVTAIKEALTALLGVPATDRGKDLSSAVKATGFIWSKPPSVYLLESSYQKKSAKQAFRPEFIRLRVAPVPKQLSTLGSGPANGNKPVAKASLTANVTRDANGDVVIKTVPMVDQGPKGYCVVATAERVFRYLGLEVDQHEMAAIANASSSGGTSPEKMLESLKKLTGRLKVHMRDLMGWNMNEFTRQIADYNRAAKHNNKPEVKIPGMKVIDIGTIYASFDPDTLKQSRTGAGKAGFTKFQRQVQEMINRGVPVMWSVELGIYPEGERLMQTKGGHMRLIIGYNTKTNEILFSDSWGEHHALKRMPMDNACAMTTGMYYLEPIQ